MVCGFIRVSNGIDRLWWRQQKSLLRHMGPCHGGSLRLGVILDTRTTKPQTEPPTDHVWVTTQSRGEGCGRPDNLAIPAPFANTLSFALLFWRGVGGDSVLLRALGKVLSQQK